jgi:hypothetical protein
MNLFIGGSRAVSRLNAPVRDRTDDLLKRGCAILVRDANGRTRPDNSISPSASTPA